MKILLVHNNKILRWADTLRAEEFKKQWTEDEVDITYAGDLFPGEKYDVIHFLYSGAVTRAKDYIMKYKDKVFTSLASQRTLDCLYDKKEELIKVYKETRCCVAQNKRLEKQLKELIGQDNVVYIPNGVDEKLFNREFIAGFVGAKDSSEHKGLFLARQACEELGIILKEAHEWSFSHEDMPKFYKEIDCLIIPSLSEGCNNPTLEALAMNIPVISTDIGIADELDGVILVNRDVEAIKGALRGLSGRIQILEQYTWKEIARKYKQLYLR